MKSLRFFLRPITLIAFGLVNLSGIVVPIEAYAVPHAGVSVGNPVKGNAAADGKGEQDGAAVDVRPSMKRYVYASPNYPIQQPCKKNEKNLDSDLCAQWYAAQSARDAADSGKIQVWLGFLGSFLVVVSISIAVWGTRSASEAVKAAKEGLAIGRDALRLSTEANDTANKALSQDRSMLRMSYEDFVRAREPNAFIIGMTLDDEWPSLFDSMADLMLSVRLRNTSQVVARRVGITFSRVSVRDFNDREVAGWSLRNERISPVRPGDDRTVEIKLSHPGQASGRAHNIVIVGEVKVLGDMMQQGPEPFRWISDRVHPGGTLVETWPEDNEDHRE